MEGILLQDLVVPDHHFLRPLHHMDHRWMIAEILILRRLMVLIMAEEVLEIVIEIVVVAGAVVVKVDNTAVAGNTVVAAAEVAEVEVEAGEDQICHPDLLILVGREGKRVMTGVEEVLAVAGKDLGSLAFSV